MERLLADDIGVLTMKLALALFAGAALGFDRELKGQAAGLRTHMLVALSAAATGALALGLSSELYAANPSVNADPLRIIEGVVAAVGFIGGGIIIRSGGQVHGLTTAANLWVCGVAGLAFGAGFYVLGAATVALAFVVLVAIGWLETVLGLKTEPGPGDKDGEA